MTPPCPKDPRDMADNSFAWAQTQPGCFRKHPVHGAEEARLTVTEKFNLKNRTAAKMKTNTRFETEVA